MLSNEQQELKKRLLDLDTAAVSDALDSLSLMGGLLGIRPRTPGCKAAGPAYTVSYEPISPDGKKFRNAGNYIDDVPMSHVIVVNNQGRVDCTSWGGILTTKARHKKVEGTVIFGSARDIQEIQSAQYPLFTTGIYMASGKNRAVVSLRQQPISVHGVTVAPGDWIFGDDNGVLVIPKEHLLTVIERAENIIRTEQKIKMAIDAGRKLVEAREAFGYATPWEAKQ